jgi:thiol-disulfide isomerase/thioredoxin
MQTTTRRALFGTAAVLVGGTLAAATLWRKPARHVYTLADATPPSAVPEPGLIVARVPAAPGLASFVDGDGVTRRIADFAGQGLELNLWATWCAPCVKEMPQLDAMAAALAEDRIAVLPLSADHGGAEVVRKFYAAHGITHLKVWLDPRGAAQEAWGARGLPTTLIVDREGREVARAEGAYDWAAPATLAEVRKLVGPATG